jgi:predicted PurR-regulated permease PerM
MNQKPTDKFEILLIVSAALLVALFLYLVKSVWSPIILGIAIIYLLYPYKSQPMVKHLLITLVLLFAIWFVYDARQILTPFVLSLGFAYLFDPLVLKLERWKIPRWLSVITIVVIVLGLFVLLLIFLVPQIIEQANRLINASIDYSSRLSDWFQNDGLALLSRFHFDTAKVQDFMLKELPGKIQTIITTFFKGFVNVTTAVSTAIGQVLNLIIVPFLFFYLLKDFPRIKLWLKSLFTPVVGQGIRVYYRHMDTAVSAFFRGQITVCLLISVTTFILLMIFGINYALILALMAGALNIIPYVGLAITLTFGILVGLFSPSPLITCIKIIAIIEVVQIIESSILSPRIVGHHVGLHPVAVIFSILVFSHFLGFLGLVIAVPVTATLRVIINAAMENHRKISGAA